MRAALVPLVLCVAASVAHAQATVPNTFSNGTVADATKVNENFQALANAINTPASPVIQFGSDAACLPQGSESYGFVFFPRPFTTPPVFIGGIDETLDDNGSVWLRIRRRLGSRVGLRCNHARGTDAVHWMAVAPGTHTIDGKKVQAGVTTFAGTVGSVTFPQAFSSPPIVLVFVDESGDNNGAIYARVNGNPTTTGFSIGIDAAADAVHWVAMEPGNYTVGRTTWTAGRQTLTAGCIANCGLSYGRTFTAAPGLITTVNDTDGSGAYWSRSKDIGVSAATSYIGDYATEAMFFVAFLND